MPGRPSHAAIAALAAAALALGACGSDDGDGTIPADSADTLLQMLTDVQGNVDDEDCTAATTDAQQFVAGVNALPKEVGVETKEELRKAGENLVAMTQDETKCALPDDEETTTTTTGASGVEGDQ